MSRKEKTSTSIKIDPDIWREWKIEAIRRRMTVSELTEQALRKELSREDIPFSNKPFQKPPFSSPNPLYKKREIRER